MKEWWEGKFDKKPDPDYILSVFWLIPVFAGLSLVGLFWLMWVLR